MWFAPHFCWAAYSRAEACCPVQGYEEEIYSPFFFFLHRFRLLIFKTICTAVFSHCHSLSDPCLALLCFIASFFSSTQQPGIPCAAEHSTTLRRHGQQYFHILATLGLTQRVRERMWCSWPERSAPAVWLYGFWSCHSPLRPVTSRHWSRLLLAQRWAISEKSTHSRAAQHLLPHCSFSSDFTYPPVLCGISPLNATSSSLLCSVFHCSGPYSGKLFKLGAFQAFPIECK